MNDIIHVGIDVGSTTVKVVAMNTNLEVLYTTYKRHFSDTKNTVCIFIKKQNRMSDTRGETIRHNMQKNTCIFVKHVKN